MAMVAKLDFGERSSWPFELGTFSLALAVILVISDQSRGVCDSSDRSSMP